MTCEYEAQWKSRQGVDTAANRRNDVKLCWLRWRTAGKSRPGASNADADRTVIYYAASYVTAQVQAAYKEMVETYNNGQGVTDGVFVQMRDNAGAISGLDSALRNNYQYDVLQLNDDEFKTLAMQGGNYFVALDDYLTDDVKTAMQWDQFSDALVNRFRMNTTPAEGGKYLAGEGTGSRHR